MYGILAGLSLSTVLTAWMAPSLKSFIAAYEVQTNVELSLVETFLSQTYGAR